MRTLVTAVLLLVVVPFRAHAQGQVWACLSGGDDLDGRVRAGQLYGRLSPDSTWQRWRASPDSARLLALHDSLVAYWTRASDSVPAARRALMDARLDTLRAELSLLHSPAGPRVRRYVVQEDVAGDSVRYRVFENSVEPQLVVAPSESNRARLAMCGTVQLAWLLATQAGDKDRMDGLARLQERAARWDNFETHGQSMTPLELTVNSLCTRCRNTRLLEPPHVQLIVGHVSPAYQINELRTKGATGREALMLEWFGVLRYTADRRHHYGVSVMSTFPSGGPSGIGATLRWSRVGNIGVLWPRDGSSNTYAAVLSVDLYRFIASGGLADRRRLTSALAGCASGASSCVPQ